MALCGEPEAEGVVSLHGHLSQSLRGLEKVAGHVAERGLLLGLGLP